MKQLRVLLDCDGVLSDFVSPVVDLVNRIQGTGFLVEDVVDWDIYKSLNVDASVGSLTDYWIKCEGFCADLEPYPGAIEGVEELRTFCDVYAVTAPFDSDFWAREREQWLIEHTGFYRKKICQVHDKHIVSGDVLVDDKIANLTRWKEHNPEGCAVLFSQPWNLTGWDGPRVKGWPALLHLLYDLANRCE